MKMVGIVETVPLIYSPEFVSLSEKRTKLIKRVNELKELFQAA